MSPGRNSNEYMKQLEEKEAQAMEDLKNGNDLDLTEADTAEFERLVWSDDFL